MKELAGGIWLVGLLLAAAGCWAATSILMCIGGIAAAASWQLEKRK